MGLVIFTVSLSIFNIALWFFFFRQFRKTFLPSKILSDISQEVNKLLIEISREVDGDLTLIEERRRGLMQLLDKADKRILLAIDEFDKRNLEKNVLTNLTTSATSVEQSSQKSKELPNTDSKQTNLFDIQVAISEDAKQALETREQEEPSNTVVQSVDKSLVIKPPLIKPPQKLSLKDQVNELHHAGFGVAEIASRLGRTKTEIEIALAVSEN